MISLLVVTTVRDLSLQYFTGSDEVQCDVCMYGDTLSTGLRATYDLIYFRDPFVVDAYRLEAIAQFIVAIRERYPASYYVDNVMSLDGLLFEDKWRQYQVLQRYMMSSRLLDAPSLAPTELAKKRISSRGRDILFDEWELAKVWMPGEYIAQELMEIRREYRVYALCGDIVPEVSIKQAKTATQKVKVNEVETIPTALQQYVAEILTRVPTLDFIGVDVAETADGFRLIEVNRAPQFARYAELSGCNLATPLVERIITRRAINKQKLLCYNRQDMQHTTLGTLEKVSFPQLGVDQVWAKIDTGAYSGAIHCTNVKVVRRDGARALQFHPAGSPNLCETTNFQTTYIRSATGHRVQRHIIETTVVVNGISYPIAIGVFDRSHMRRSVLIGRRFLREQNLLVDVRINQEYDDEGGNTR